MRHIIAETLEQERVEINYATPTIPFALTWRRQGRPGFPILDDVRVHEEYQTYGT